MAAADLRGRGPAGQAGLGLGEIRVRQLDHAELGRRQPLAARGARRAGSTTSWSPGSSRRRVSARRRRLSASAMRARGRLREVDGYPARPMPRWLPILPRRETRFGDRAAVLVETTLLRRKAAAKFADPSDWLFTDEALQQATAEPVAAHRARRLAGSRVHDATCSIGTELAALRNSADFVVGSDIDPVRLAMAGHNVADVDLCPRRRAAAGHPRRRRPRRPRPAQRRTAPVRPPRLHAAAG